MAVIELSRFVDKKLNADDTDTTLWKSLSMIGVGCTSLMIGFTFLITEFVYLLYALKVDPFLYPTYIMLTLYIGNFASGVGRTLYHSVTKKKIKSDGKTTAWMHCMRIVTSVYFGYMLWAIIS